MTTLDNAPRGIAGLTGREPIGAALTIGIKGSNGAPTEKDRFHILDATPGSKDFQTREGKTYSSPVRDPHPSFAVFNSAAIERRRVVPARLAHATIAEMFEYRRQAAKLPGHEHPKKAPSCIGDGMKAIRYMGNAQDYTDIVCPGDKCEFAVAGPNDRNGRPTAPLCKPWMRFIARFDWAVTDGKRLPNIPFKFTSGGWNNVRSFIGFFDAFRRACEGFGVEPDRVPLFGMPVLLTLTEKTNPETKSRFPVVSIQTNGDVDVIAWIGEQLKRGDEIRRLSAVSPLALTDRALQSPEVLDADYEDIRGPLSVPSAK